MSGCFGRKQQIVPVSSEETVEKTKSETDEPVPNLELQIAENDPLRFVRLDMIKLFPEQLELANKNRLDDGGTLFMKALAQNGVVKSVVQKVNLSRNRLNHFDAHILAATSIVELNLAANNLNGLLLVLVLSCLPFAF